MVLEKTHESPLYCKEIKPVNTKANKLSIFIGRTEAEALILWPPDTNESLEMTVMLGKVEGKRRRRQQRTRWLDSTIDSRDMNLSKLQEIVEDRRGWRAAVHWVTKSWTQQQHIHNHIYMCAYKTYIYASITNILIAVIGIYIKLVQK